MREIHIKLSVQPKFVFTIISEHYFLSFPGELVSFWAVSDSAGVVEGQVLVDVE